MSQVVPSQVVALVDRAYPWAQNEAPPGALDSHNAPIISAIVALVDQLPQESLAFLSPDERILVIAATEAMRTSVRMWETPSHPGYQHRLGNTPALNNRHPVAVVRNAIVKCPDDVPSSSVSHVSFLADNDLENALRQDIATSYSALANREFKAAAVIAGSVIEALLLWALKRKTSADHKAAWTSWEQACVKAGQQTPPKLQTDILRWDLATFIEIARYAHVSWRALWPTPHHSRRGFAT